MAINEDQQQSLEEVARIRSERIPEPKEPIKIETEGVFNQDYLEEAEPKPFDDNSMVPMMMMRAAAAEYVKAIRAQPPAFAEPPKSEHKVRIYQLTAEYNQAALEAFAAEMEAFLNEGYCCHMPTVVNDYVIMDFSRRKESEENEKI